ncbi:MAG: hypothetical protein JWM59_2615 [Verrucomicrobiales bacterium]|nr:hypothetical protein [Verrucomicrobiales bacterium]
MAYNCFLASVPHEQLGGIRVPADLQRLASRIMMVSHYIAPACAPVTRAMDGGSHLETDTWHPLRGFKFHSPADVCGIALELAALERDICINWT